MALMELANAYFHIHGTTQMEIVIVAQLITQCLLLGHVVCIFLCVLKLKKEALECFKILYFKTFQNSLLAKINTAIPMLAPLQFKTINHKLHVFRKLFYLGSMFFFVMDMKKFFEAIDLKND